MGDVSGDPFLLGKKTSGVTKETCHDERKEKAKRHEHSFRDPRMRCIVRPADRDHDGD